MALLDFRSFLESPIFESMEVGMQDIMAPVATLPLISQDGLCKEFIQCSDLQQLAKVIPTEF